MGTMTVGRGAQADWGPGVGMRWETTQSGAENGGELCEGTMWIAGRMAGPPVHVHPGAAESFGVLEGEIEVQVDGTWQTVSAGETVEVPAGVPHTVRNLSGTPAKLTNKHWPAGEMESFFLDGGRLTQEQKIKALPPKDPKSAVYAAMLFTKYPEDIRATGPAFVAFKVLSAVGRALGFKI